MTSGASKALALAAFVTGAMAAYHPLLPGKQVITSTFGEFRVGHFHAGIDLRAHVGTPVYAPADGWIEKVATSPWGYGKVIYFVFDDTLTAVFGHLSSFAEPVQKKVLEKQYEARSQVVSILFGRGEFSFRAGDVLGYTGGTGSGRPHLHFEVRRKNNKPVAPQLLGFTPLDTIPPTIEKAALVPISQDAWIEESLLPLIVEPGDDYTSLRRPVRIWGKVGVAVAFFDLAEEGNPNHLGARTLTLSIDGETIYHCRYDSFSYTESADVGFLYDGGLEYLYGARFHKLFVPDSLAITPLYGNKPYGGIIDAAALTPQPHILKWEITDFAENSAAGSVAVVPAPVEDVSLQFTYDDEHRLCVEVMGDPHDVAIMFCPEGETTFTTIAQDEKIIPVEGRRGFFKPVGLQHRQIYPFILGTPEERSYKSEQCSLFALGNYLYYLVKLDVPPPCVPEFAILGVSIEYQMLSPTVWLLRHSYEELGNLQSPAVEVFIGDPDFPFARLGEFCPVFCLMGSWSESHHRERLWDAAVRVPGDALIEPKALYNWYEEVQGANIASPLFHFLPEWLYFRQPARLVFKPTAQNPIPTDSLRKLCIVRWWKNDWHYVPTKHRGREIRAKVRALGSFALMWDKKPPEVKLIRVLRDTLVVSVVDDLSGFGAENLPQAWIDGDWVLAEYDPDEDVVLVLPRKPLRTGKHTLRIVAEDRAENKTETTFEVTVGR